MHDEITRGQARHVPRITTAVVPVYIRMVKCHELQRRRLTYLVRCALRVGPSILRQVAVALVGSGTD